MSLETKIADHTQDGPLKIDCSWHSDGNSLEGKWERKGIQ